MLDIKEFKEEDKIRVTGGIRVMKYAECITLDVKAGFL